MYRPALCIPYVAPCTGPPYVAPMQRHVQACLQTPIHREWVGWPAVPADPLSPQRPCRRRLGAAPFRAVPAAARTRESGPAGGRLEARAGLTRDDGPGPGPPSEPYAHARARSHLLRAHALPPHPTPPHPPPIHALVETSSTIHPSTHHPPPPPICAASASSRSLLRGGGGVGRREGRGGREGGRGRG